MPSLRVLLAAMPAANPTAPISPELLIQARPIRGKGLLAGLADDLFARINRVSRGIVVCRNQPRAPVRLLPRMEAEETRDSRALPR